MHEFVFFYPKLSGKCDHQGDKSVFSEEEYQSRFAAFKEEIESFMLINPL